jgi:hypothetical protein
MPTAAVVQSVTLVSIEQGTLDYAQGRYEETHVYRVQFSNTFARAIEAQNAKGDPDAHDGMPDYTSQLIASDGTATGIYVTKREAKQNKDDKSVWDVFITYSAGSETSKSKPPTVTGKWNVLTSTNPIARTYNIMQDTNNLPVVNSSGEPFDPPLNETIYDTQINISFFTSAVVWTTIEGTIGHCNDAPVTLILQNGPRDFDKHELYFQSYTGQDLYDNVGAKIAQFTYTFLAKTDGNGFTHLIEDAGYNQLDDDGKLTPILDAANQPITTPQYLNGGGRPLAPGATVITLEFETITDVNFTPLLAGL